MNSRFAHVATINRNCISLLLLIILLIWCTVGFGQNRSPRGMVSFGASSGLVDDTLYLDPNQDIAVQLLPFEELMKIALLHSPYIKYQNEVANALGEARLVTRLQILQNVSGYVNYSTGNQSIFSSGGAVIPGQDVLGQIANGYRVGVDVRLPLYELFGRKHQVQQAQANYKAAIVQKEIIEQQLKRDLISVYQDMITTQQLLKTYLIDEQASLTALRLAEVDLQKGQITADAVANTTSRYVLAKVASEQSKGTFLKNVYFFETLMGTPLQRLKRN